MTLTKVLRAPGRNETLHGFRSSFRHEYDEPTQCGASERLG
jgi:hypothetical protein